MTNLKAIKPVARQYPEPLKGMKEVAGRLPKQAINKFKAAIEKGDETSAHQVLVDYPGLMRDIMPKVGHHAMWYCSKPQIRPPLTNGKTGKIPDFLLAGRGSGGMSWFIVELKPPNKQLFNKNYASFSTYTNYGLNQLAAYLHYANEKQGSIRDSLEIPDFRTPNGILIIGREEETLNDEVKMDTKAFWNDNLKNIEIISYDRIIKKAEFRLAHME